MQSQDAEAAARRGWVARQMIAEDARWAMDVVLSCEKSRSAASYVILILGHHLVRIAYEGAVAIRSRHPNVGIPEFAALLKDQFATITKRTRHTSKILDHSGVTYNAVIDGLEIIQRIHNDRFTGNAHRWLRWLETDLGLYQYEGELIGATVPAAYRLGFDVAEGAEIAVEDLREAVEEWGGTLAVLGAATLDISEPSATIDFIKRPKVSPVDRLSARYLARRFDKKFPSGLKLLLLMIEGDLNSSRLLLPRATKRHEMAVFRAQAITAYHALTSLRKIADRHLGGDSSGSRQLRKLLNDAPTRRLLSNQGKKIRDRCVHYPILNPTFEPDLSLPMYGIIENVAPGMTWERYSHDVTAVTSRAANCLASWEPGLA